MVSVRESVKPSALATLFLGSKIKPYYLALKPHSNNCLLVLVHLFFCVLA